MKKIIKIIISFLLLFCSIRIFAQDPNDTRSISTISSGTNMSGSYAIWWGNTKHLILKPFIICEGFDPVNNIGAADVYNDQVGSQFCNSLKNAGYDVIVLNLNNNTMAIEKNADLFIALINTINGELAANKSYHRLNVLGVSMGGLILRYALAKMETQGLDHRVENYISFDSPQLGANIPLGLQQMLDTYLGPLLKLAEWNTVLDKLNSGGLRYLTANLSNSIIGADITKIADLADFSAALEMSACYMHDNTWRASYLNNLHNAGDMPHNCRNIAVALGSNADQGFGTGVQLLGFNQNLTLVDMSLTLPFDLGEANFKWTPLNINNQVNTMLGIDGYTFSTALEIQPMINAPVGGPNYAKTFIEHDRITAPYDLRLDNAPGSYYDLNLSDLENWLDTKVSLPFELSQTVCIPAPLVGKICRTVSKKFTLTFYRSQIFGQLSTGTNFRFCFVPTLSALAINNRNWFFTDINTIVPNYPYPNDKTVTPFDAIHYSTGNNLHPFMDEPTDPSSVYTFLTNELMPGTLYIQNRHFNSTYSNVFEASTIYVGSDVEPNTKKNSVGNVTSDAGSIITIRVPNKGSVILKNGCSLLGNVDIIADASYTKSTPAPVKTAGTTSKTANTGTATLKSAIPPGPVMTEYSYSSTTTITDDDINILKSGNISTDIHYDVPETKIEIYPNPVLNGESKVFLEISKSTMVKATITSMQGSLIRNIINQSYNPGFYLVNFNIADLPKGLYLCNIYYDGLCKTIKLVVQ